MSLLPKDTDMQQSPKLEIPELRIESMYNKEAVGHLVDQLVKLHNTYDNTSSRRVGSNHDEEVINGMKTINDALAKALTFNISLDK